MADCPPGLVEFLRAAKAATYAAQGDDASVPPALPDSKQLEFRDGPFLYRDIYLGMFRFVGQEVVYLADRALWSMSYAGGLAPGVAQSAGRPIAWQGSLQSFHGSEGIHEGGRAVYELRFSGGMLA